MAGASNVQQAQLRYREKHRELISLRKKVARLEDIDKQRKIDRENWHTKRKENKEYIEKQRVWREQNRENRKAKRDELRRCAIEAYGGRCMCCGESEMQFLCIDHIDGGGVKHRREIKGGSMYYWLKKNGYPEGFQTLCHNCNCAKGFYGRCPHNKVL